MKNLNKNIKLSYIYNFLFYCKITNIIWVIYLSFKGIPLFQIGLLESIFHISSFIFEIPSGAIADIYGRKFSIICSRICSIISSIIIVSTNSFILISISFVFSALSYNLNSGSAEALTYDTLKELNRENEYKRIFGNISAIAEVARAAAALIGGVLSQKSFLYAYIGSIIVDIFSVIIGFRFVEAKHDSLENNDSNSHKEKYSLYSQMRESLSIIMKNKYLMYLMIFSELIALISTTVYFYSQKYFEIMKFNKTQLGIIYTITSIVCAVVTKYSYNIEKHLNKKGIFICLPIISILSLLGLSMSKKYFSVIFFILLCTGDAIGYPIFSDYINSLIPSEKRATIISMESCFFSIMMIFIFPLTGFIADKTNFKTAFMFLGIIILPIIFIITKIKYIKTKS